MKIIHKQIIIQYKLLDRNTLPYYRYKPVQVLESVNMILYMDKYIITDKTAEFNRPDILLIDRGNKTAFVIDTEVPLTHNVNTGADKIMKYENLALEIKDSGSLKTYLYSP